MPVLCDNQRVYLPVKPHPAAFVRSAQAYGPAQQAVRGYSSRNHGLRMTRCAAMEGASPVVQAQAHPEGVASSVVIAVDNTNDAVQALKWTTSNILQPGEQLCLVHAVVNDRPVATAVGASATGARLAMSSLDVDMSIGIRDYMEQLRTRGEDLVENKFVPHLQDHDITYKVVVEVQDGGRNAADIGAILSRAAKRNNARVLAVASHGSGLLADFGSVARNCIQNHKGATLLLPPNCMNIAEPNNQSVVIAVNNIDELKEAAQWTASNVVKSGDVVHVLAVAQDDGNHAAWHDVLSSAGVPNAEVKFIAPQNANQEAGATVCRRISDLTARVSVMINYANAGMVKEMMMGGLANYCSRNMRRPLLLLPASQ